MKTFLTLTKRNTKIFFKDKAMFFTSLITPIILLVLYTTFLAKVFKDSFATSLPEGFAISNSLINGFVSGELISSLLAVCCVTVAFCSNIIMVQDKVNGALKDFHITPVKKSKLALSYLASTIITTLIVNFIALVAGLIYIAITGWFMSFLDVLLLFVDVVLLTCFGSIFSSIINMFLTTNGQASAFGTIISAGYGFICGAYMPISQFGTGLQTAFSFLPGTYGTALLRNHALAGAYREMSSTGVPTNVLERIKDSVDCNIYFFGNKVNIMGMYLILIGSILVLIGLYVLLGYLKNRKFKV